MRSTKLHFEGADGSRLVGRLDVPADGAPYAYALFAHCFTCSKDIKAAVNLSRALTGVRIAVFRFDFTGLGESEGDFADTNFSSNVEDLVAAARFLERKHVAPAILVGHSLGGAAVIRAAAEIPSARAVATIGAPCDPAHIRHHLTDSVEEIEEHGEAEVTLAGRPFRIRRQFLEDLEETRMREAIAGLGRALLIFHSPTDRVVGIENAARIYQAAKHPKSFVSLDGANHLLTRQADSRWTGQVLAAWASRYVDSPPARPEQPSDREGGIVVRTGGSGYRTAILAAGHSLVADEPVAVGGTDEGPTPYDLLAASLGACTSITLRMYADRKGWPLEEIRVRLTHRKVHAEDERQCESEPAKIDEIRRTITLAGKLEAEQRARLMEIADRCPVHRTLDAGVCVVTEEVPED